LFGALNGRSFPLEARGYAGFRQSGSQAVHSAAGEFSFGFFGEIFMQISQAIRCAAFPAAPDDLPSGPGHHQFVLARGTVQDFSFKSVHSFFYVDF